MPPLPPVPGVLRVQLQGNGTTVENFPWENILHFTFAGTAPTSATCATVAADIGTLWATNMAPRCPSPTVLNLVAVTDLSSNTAGNGQSEVTHAGTRGDDEIPANAAMLISYPVSVRYRGGHPRQYLFVGGNADFLDSANWSAAFVTEVQTAWRAFLAGVEAISVAGLIINGFCAVSYIDKSLNPIPPYRRTTPLVYPIVASGAIANQEMASQKRRIGRRRR